MLSCFIFFLIFPLFVDCQEYQTKRFQQVTYKSEIHKRLVNHVYKITHGNDPQHCLSDCWSENHICQSFNYLALQDLCELNNASAIDFASDLQTYDMSVYFTNPAFGDTVAPSIERNNITYPSTPPDVCASGPCKSGQCVLDDKLGFRCINCSASHYGKMCELFKDPCLLNPCLYEGICSSQPGATTITCACTTRFSGTRCQDGVADYDFNLGSASQYPKYKMDNSISLSQMTLCFWYRTSQTLSYFFSYTPDDAQRNEQILIWRNETKVYVRLGDSGIQSFDDFQFIDGIAWNHLCVIWNITGGQMILYSQGAQRNDAKLDISASFQLSPGSFDLGYYAHPTDGAQYFTGHISQLNIWDYVKNTAEVLALSEACLSEPGNVWNWTNIMWKGGSIEKPGATCTTRVPSKTYNVFKFKYHASYTPKLYFNDKQLDTDSLTISVWFRLANTDKKMRIFELCYSSTPRIYLLYTDTGIEFKLNDHKTTVKLPIFKSTWCHLVVTWSGLNDTVEFILNGVWQSWKKNYFLLLRISESLRATAGVYDAQNVDKFDGEIANVNIWKRILPAAYIVAMSRYAGDDIGDHFAWKDILETMPTTACYELVMARHENIVRERPTQLSFGENSGSVETTVMTPDSVTELTICLWFKLSSFRPLKLITHNPTDSTTALLELSIDADHIININMSGLASAVSPVLQESYKNQWQHLCVAWSNSHGLLSWFRWNSIIVSTTFRRGHTLTFKGPWIIGKNANGENIEGSIAHVNVWSTYLVTYSTLVNGVMNLEGDLVTWPQFVNNSLSGVTLGFADELFLPDLDILLKRDVYCASLDAEQCYEYARTAWDLNGFTWACVCPGALYSGIATHQDLNSSLSTISPDLATMN